MTVIHVMTPQGRLNVDQRRVLAKTLTDAVLVPEVGRLAPEKRRGYQVHFIERPLDMIAHGGELLSDKPSDVMVLDVVVMDCCWTREDRAAVIRNIFAALTEACGMKAPSPTWWINFRIIDEGCWGSRGGVLSFLDLLDPSAYPPERGRRSARRLPSNMTDNGGHRHDERGQDSHRDAWPRLQDRH